MPVYFGSHKVKPLGFSKMYWGSNLIWASASQYRHIDPIDPVAFPVHNGLRAITLDGSETWSLAGGGCYTSAYGDIIKSQRRDSVVGFCADYTFYPNITGLGDLPQNGFMFNGTSANPVNGNLSFKNEHTTSSAAWKAWLTEHPLTVLISVNNPDASEWKPALREAENATGYWNGANGFIEVYGGIPYLGENLLTEGIIQNFYSAWISAAYAWALTSDSATIKVPVEAGKYYRLSWNTDGETGTIFRYGFVAADVEPRSGSSPTLSAPRARTTPQDTPFVDVLSSDDAIVVQAARVVSADPQSIRFRQLSVREMVGYQPPAITMMAPPRPDPEPDPDEPEEEPEEQV